jgi:hypothetical protein
MKTKGYSKGGMKTKGYAKGGKADKDMEDAQERAVSALKREAAFLIDHAGMLEFRIETHHGQPLQRRESDIERIKETFDSMPAAYARAEELKLEGWKARVGRRNYDSHTTLTATR